MVALWQRRPGVGDRDHFQGPELEVLLWSLLGEVVSTLFSNQVEVLGYGQSWESSQVTGSRVTDER